MSTRTPNSTSSVSMMRPWANESQPGTSAAVVSAVTTAWAAPVSLRTARRIASSISSSVIAISTIPCKSCGNLLHVHLAADLTAGGLDQPSLIDEVHGFRHHVRHGENTGQDFRLEFAFRARGIAHPFGDDNQPLRAVAVIRPGDSHRSAWFQASDLAHQIFDFVCIDVAPVDDDQIVDPTEYIQPSVEHEAKVAGKKQPIAQLCTRPFRILVVAGEQEVAGDGDLANMALRQGCPCLIKDSNRNAGDRGAAFDQLAVALAPVAQAD